jgi:ribosomal protein S18 acetylase RimI-like enzyme
VAVRIRAAGQSDLPSILSLFHELDRYQADWRVFSPRVGFREDMRAYYEAALHDPDALLVVAETEDGVVVGMALGRLHRPSSFSDELAVELSSAVVSTARRGEGIGRALAAEIGRFARATGVERVTLKTFSRNQPALRFWRSLGFEPRIVQMTIRCAELLPGQGESD